MEFSIGALLPSGRAKVSATPVLIPGNMCDRRLWPDRVRSLLSGAVDADVTQDDRVAGMAQRILSSIDGPLLPIGFSMGAIVALAMAELAPHRITALGLLDLNASADLAERSIERPRQQAEVRRGALERLVVEELKPNYLAERNRRDPALLTLLRSMALELGPDVFIRQSEALRTRRDLTPVLSALRCPVFLACGEEDLLCPPEWHKRWADMIGPSVSLEIIGGAGHMLPLEQPIELGARMANWLETHGLVACPAES